MPTPTSVTVARVYDQPTRRNDASRILVDRLWPRGLSKEAADLDEWCREVAPSNELRIWYGHDPAKFDHFADRYRAELASTPRAELVTALVDTADQRGVTLLTATKQLKLSHAQVLAAVIESHLYGR
jgi:uncharacterized protein YeaO (DUF488 family)